jgi:hypothetical protein
MTTAAPSLRIGRCLQSRVRVTDILDHDAATAPDSEIYASGVQWSVMSTRALSFKIVPLLPLPEA